MATVNLFSITIAGDVGGNGVARLAFTNSSATPCLPAEVNTAVTSATSMLNAVKSIFPIDIGWQPQILVQCVEAATGGLQGETTGTVGSSTVQGTATGNYVAGVGARGYWHTNTIVNRRFVRGATFFCPLIGSAFGTNGELSGTYQPQIIAAMTAWTSGLITGGLTPVVWHRPTKLNPSGGLAAPITASSCSYTAASLRSRRS